MEKQHIFAHIASLADSHERIAVATVVRTYGSTPREVGARMVVLPDGSFTGTIGGGCGEAEVWQEARRALRRQQPVLMGVDLTEEADSPQRADGRLPDAAGNAVCGGRMDVFVDLWDRSDMREAANLVSLMEGDHGVSLVTVVDAPSQAPCRPGAHVVVVDSEGARGSLGASALDQRVVETAHRALAARRPALAMVPLASDAPILMPAPRKGSEEALSLFVDVLEQPPVLVIAGAGHCALPLSRLARMLGFRVIILDDRPECATSERFPDAARLLVGDLEEQAAHLPLDRNTYVVLVTRGHRLDETVLRRIARAPLGYIGMIGSRRRVGVVLANMARDGYEPVHLDRIHSPIGLDIGALTPEEIAVSIMGEIIMVRRGGTGAPLSQKRPPLPASAPHPDAVDTRSQR